MVVRRGDSRCLSVVGGAADSVKWGVVECVYFDGAENEKPDSTGIERSVGSDFKQK